MIKFIFICFLASGLASPPGDPRQRPTPREGSCASVPDWMKGDRIVGGADAPKPIQWQVSVRSCQAGYCHFCGGTILDATTVMSAAHCFDQGQSMAGYYVMAGATGRSSDSGQTIGVANGVWNADMPYQGNNNDFVILKLSSALEFNDDVAAACLPDASFAPDESGQTCYVSGWGTLESGANSLPENLQYVGVPMITNEKCNAAYGGITSSMICAGLDEGGKDSCQGDSGGPLVCEVNGQAHLTGVVSFGYGCAFPNWPGVYARMTAVLSWAKENMGDGGSSPPSPSPPSPNPPAPQPPTDECVDKNDAWWGDGYCDDFMNSEICGFDGGDCCQESPAPGWDNYCDECDCLEDVGGEPTTEPPMDECEDKNDAWWGDGYCDDFMNTEGCGFDGGDCCQESPAPGWDNYCDECDCLEDTFGGEPTTEPPMDECEDKNDAWWGDGYCDDFMNTEGCGFDGGDCCQESPAPGWDNYCDECECLEDTFGGEPTTESPKEDCPDKNEFWWGDNYCDDFMSDENCGFDGGDCCQTAPAPGWDNYCQDCVCKM